MPFNLGGPELLILLLIVLVVFGAGRLPQAFSQVGRGVRAFRTEMSGGDAPKAAPSDAPEGRDPA